MVLLKKKPNPPLSAADAAGITHMILANILLIVGQFTSLLPEISKKFKEPGIAFIYQYLDKPVFEFLVSWFPWIGKLKGGFYNFLSVELVIVSASVFYGFIVYVVLKLVYVILGMDEAFKTGVQK